MKRRTIAVLILLLTTLAARAQQDQLPPPPKGYSWEWCADIKGAFLRPDGWFFKKAKQGDTWGYFISREQIKDGKQFNTGLTVNVMPDIPRKKSMSPYRFAQLFRESARKTEKFSKEWDKDMGPFRSVGFVYTSTAKGDRAGPFTVHNLLIANDKTGTLYLVMFEAPAAEWDTAWKIADPILNLLYIDDTI